jgi:soluble lytic murein transglycosylase-like protein
VKTTALRLAAAAVAGLTVTTAFAGPAPSSATALQAAVAAAMKRPDASFDDPYVQTVWLNVMSERLARYVADPAKRRQLLLLVHAEAVHAGVPPELVLSIINVESDFDPWAVSSAGAQGLMQIMPFWLKSDGRPGDNLFDPRTNLRLGCTILAYYLKRAHGDIALALQGYYGKEYDNQYAGRVLRLLSDRWYWQR